jgi:5-methylcytosine-specific restriction endonuclease McrA
MLWPVLWRRRQRTTGTLMSDDTPMKRCRKCGEEKPLSEFHKNAQNRDRLSSLCKPCNCAHAAAYRNANLEKERERARARAAAEDPEQKRARQRAWCAANLERRRAIVAKSAAANAEKRAAYRAANKERKAAANAAYGAANRERLAKNNAAWCAANPDKVAAHGRARQARRRARKRNTECDPTANHQTVAAMFGSTCYICGVLTEPNAPPRSRYKAELEHVIPLSKGGTHTFDNLRIACHRCNRRKGVRTLEGIRAFIDEMLS